MIAHKLDQYLELLQRVDPIRINGNVSQVIGLTVEANGPDARIGDICLIYPHKSDQPVLAEVVGFKKNHVLLMPIGELGSIGPGCDVVATGKPLTVKVGEQLLGKVLDGLGHPMDGSKFTVGMREYPTNASPPNPLDRPPIDSPIAVGVKAIDGLLTVGRGQRVGIFAGSGVGKSTLLGMIARNTSADINVIALIGERGREVNEFLERDLGEEGLRRSVVVVATSDQPALVRIKGALVATTIAEFFRDSGKDVMLMMDSVTRFAAAAREVGLAIGEPPATRGYTPSVFAALPRLLERAGSTKRGSITAFYTVLVDGDDMNDPIADSVRGILDGHIVLNRNIAQKGHYPAIDILQSVSRVMNQITTKQHQTAANHFRRLMAIYRDAEDLINIGAYKQGTNREIDMAIQFRNKMIEFTAQDFTQRPAFEETVQMLVSQFEGVKL